MEFYIMTQLASKNQFISKKKMNSVLFLSLVLASNVLLVLLASAASSSSSSSSDDGNSSARFAKCLIQFTNSSSILGNSYTPNNASYSPFYTSGIRNLRPEAASEHKLIRAMLILTPRYESEIQAAVGCSKQLGIQLRVRSGGHDYEGLSYLGSKDHSFVMIDMTYFRTISVSKNDHTAWVQSGATLGELYYSIAQASSTLAYPAGVCPTVGIGGHLSGGGYGMISRKHGLAIDHIIDARIINANGRLLERKGMGEDLFWAIRGGGGNSFGIVIAFKVNLVVVPETVTVFNVSRTLEHTNATQLVHKWQTVFHKIDENLVLKLFLRSATRKKSVQTYFAGLYLGRVDDLLAIMQHTFPELGLVKNDCTEMSWIESEGFFWAHDENESLENLLLQRIQPNVWYFKGKSDFVRKPIPEHGLEGLWKFFDEQVENHVELQLSPYGGVISKIPQSETPFPHRAGNLYMIHYYVYWTTEELADSERLMDWIQRLYRYMTPYVSDSPRAAYLNYRDLDLGMNNIEEGGTSYKQASIWGFKYFKNNFNRLVRVKTKVDPSNLFRNEQSIPPFMLSRMTKLDNAVVSI